ncbi:hypothetical protein MRB53_031694 [Persea americana]|uniref:Uncharacterized protein n=1 Tax=Persea americana TaxID=3435 RepID=A0ACC2KQ75_PERAE|nr:hypothetical protein MRB53_031694 [Persea americana]
MSSFLLLRSSFPPHKPLLHYGFPSLLSSHRCSITSRPFSTSSSPLIQPDPTPPKFPDPKTTLSSRMSFVFDQIDAIERERSGKDEALQRIRSWREQKQKTQASVSESGHLGVDELSSESAEKKKDNIFTTKEIEVVHPWPEWIEFMERLVQQNYFDHRRKDEDGMIPNVPLDDVGGLGFVEEGFDFTRDWITVRTACLNFGRDRFDILRSLSRKDIQILVGHGCPSTDSKVVFSAKLLRKHVHLDEGDVCSSCSLRSSCSRAYLLTRKEDEARTLDIMRVLLTFGFDPVTGSVENKTLLKLKSVKTVVRKLLHEVVKLSAVPIDPNLPPPVIKRPPPKVKQPPPPPKKRVGRDDIEMKKGDWLCPKCDFMNFAKNTVCLQCDAKRPKRQLLPGEWECPECNFLNYRRNMVCFHCEHKRPPDDFMENQVQVKPHGLRTRLERAANIPGVSNAWNFDFDDNESDGADVAAFEFADPPRMGEDTPDDGHAYRGNSREFQDDSFENIRTREIQERGRYPEPDQRKPPFPIKGSGFDDFDDEEDDVDSYELDIPNSNSKQEISSMKVGVEGFSKSEDFDDSNHYSRTRGGADIPSRPARGMSAFSGSDDDHEADQDFDSDSELSVHPNWKSSHVADSRQRTKGRGGSGLSRGLSFGSDSDDELGLNSDSDNEDRCLGSKWDKTKTHTSLNRKGRRKESLGSDDELMFDSESDGDHGRRSHRNKMRGNRSGSDRRENAFEQRDRSGSRRDSRFRSNDMMGYTGNSFVGTDGDRYSGNSRRDGRESRGDAYGGRRGNGRGGNLRDFDRPAGDSYGGRRGNGRGGSLRDFDRPAGDSSGGRRGNVRGSDLGDFDRPAGDSYGGWRGNGRGGDLRDFNRPARKQDFGLRPQGRFDKLDDRSERARGLGDNRPRRRIIER